MNRALTAAFLALVPLTGLPALGQDSKQPAKPVWPEAKSKKLYAKNDLRGKAAPAFHVESWLGKEPDRQGKVVLIDFWATWCPPCRELIPELTALKAKFKDDLVVIGVSDENKDKVQTFLEKTPAGYAMAIDTTARMKKAVGVEGIPHVLIIDSAGVVRWQGFPQSDEDKLTEQTIQKIIDADKAAHPRSKSSSPVPSGTDPKTHKPEPSTTDPKPPKKTGGG